MNELNELVKSAISNDLNLAFTYANKNKMKVAYREVNPVEIIGNTLVAVDLDNDEYRRFSYDNMSNVNVI